MENKTKWIIGIIGNILPLLLTFLITRVFIQPHPSWWWFLAVLIFIVLADIVTGIVIYFKYISSQKLPEQKLDPMEALKTAKKMKVEETDNPDNVQVHYVRILNVGEPGKTRTPILRIHGKGTELGNILDGLIDLSKKEVICCWIENGTEETIKDIAVRMAENPEMYETESKTMTLDDFGRPQTRVETRKVTQAQKQAEENKKQAEELNKL